MQVLSNGNAFINWADDSRISEHTSDGSIIAFEAWLPAHVDTYRAFKFPWIGRPKLPPDVHAEVVWGSHHHMDTTVSMSWNGATEVDKWAIHGIDADGKPVHIATVPRAGFETTLTHAGLATNVYADALDRHGTVLGTSKDGGRAWPERIPGRSNGRQENKSTSILQSVIFGVSIVILALGGLFFYLRSKRQAEVLEVKDKGEYRQLGQDEEAADG